MIQFLQDILNLNDGIFRAWWFDPAIAQSLVHDFHQISTGIMNESTVLRPIHMRVSLESGPVAQSRYSICHIAYWIFILVWKVIAPPDHRRVCGMVYRRRPWKSSCIYCGGGNIWHYLLYDAIFFVLHCGPCTKFPVCDVDAEARHHTVSKEHSSSLYCRRNTPSAWVTILVQRSCL